LVSFNSTTGHGYEYSGVNGAVSENELATIADSGVDEAFITDTLVSFKSTTGHGYEYSGVNGPSAISGKKEVILKY
jgi:hypothetical protein